MNKTVLAIGILFLLIGVSVVSSTDNISKISSVNKSNNPPYPPSNPKPCNGTINMSICPLNLSWTSEGDPDGDNVTFDVWFGDSEVGIYQVSWNQTENWVFIEGTLNFNKKYFWYVVVWDEHGAYTEGPTWSFITEENVPPNPAEDPYPPDGDTIPLYEGFILCWNGSDPNLCDSLRYDLYFDDVNPPLTQVFWQTYDNCWEIPFGLTKYETYYWRVDTYDREGEFTEGYVWRFTVGENHPPNKVIIEGPTHGKVGVEYTYTFNVTDDDGHSIKFYVNWGDGTIEQTGFHPNGTIVTLSHSWDTKGTYIIRVKAIDEYGDEGPWGILAVTIPRDKSTNNVLLRGSVELITFIDAYAYGFKIKGIGLSGHIEIWGVDRTIDLEGYRYPLFPLGESHFVVSTDHVIAPHFIGIWRKVSVDTYSINGIALGNIEWS